MISRQPDAMPQPALAPTVAACAPPSSQSERSVARTAPKKSKKKGGGTSPKRKSDAPIFLRKTYEMIDSSDPRVASWSDDGDTFVVKNPDLFASLVIPQFFRHNNFKSFVRQLNFYGFRKVRSDAIRIGKADGEDGHWRFHHENFRRGRPDLLGSIKKSNQSSADSSAGSADALREEVQTLRDRINVMSGDIERLTAMVESMTAERGGGAAETTKTPAPGAGSKKRKIEPTPMPVPSSSVAPPPDAGPVPLHVPSAPSEPVDPAPADPMHVDPATLIDPITASDEDLLLDALDCAPGSMFPPRPSPGGLLHQSSVTSLDVDQAFLDEFLADDYGGEDMNAGSDSAVPPHTEVKTEDDCETEPSLDPRLEEKLRDALSTLPRPMQELFAERLAAIVCDPDGFRERADAVAALAEAAARETRRRTVVPGSIEEGGGGQSAGEEEEGGGPGSVPVSLATATLGAFLAQYALSAGDGAKDGDGGSSCQPWGGPSAVPLEG